MATPHTTNGAAGIEAALEQMKDLNDQMLAAARKAGKLYVDSYEKAVDRTVGLELKLAGLTQQEWLKSVVEAQTELTRDFADSYTATARSLLK